MNLNEDLPVWQQPESRRLEFKEVFPSGNQLARTVIAFANGAGGRVVFGIRDNPREIVGIPDEEIFRLEERIAQHIADQCAPLIIPDIYIQACEGKNLLVVEVFPGSQKPYYLKSQGKSGGTYVRIGSTDKPASEEMREELERQRRKISFDAMPVFNLFFAEVDLTQFKNDYRKATGRTLENDQLKNMGLLFQDRDQWFPTHAAVLLSESPVRKQLFPYAKIECARFKGTDTRVFLDQMTIEGPIYAAVEPCLAFIKKISHFLRKSQAYIEKTDGSIPWRQFGKPSVTPLFIAITLSWEATSRGQFSMICWRLPAPDHYRTPCPLRSWEPAARKSEIAFSHPFSKI